jgi:1-deoxy-D-xylulose-5-phosphate reductoisomerase
MATPAQRLDLVELARLDFEAPDLARFPALRLAREALVAGGAAPVVLNAANEVAVARFLAGSLGFAHIARVVEYALQSQVHAPPASIAEVMEVDRVTRCEVEAAMASAAA